MKRFVLFHVLAVSVGVLLFVAACERPGNGPDTTTPTTTTPPAVTTTTTVQTDDDRTGLVVEVYVPDKVYPGTTLLGDILNSRVVEVSMEGDILWEYELPEEYADIGQSAIEAERLDNDNIQALFPGTGIFEISRGGDGNQDGDIVWSYLNPKMSHDADRLADGNVLYVFGSNDQKTDTQVREIDTAGRTVWQWKAWEHYEQRFGELGTDDGGWAHTNGVQRLENGTTLISMRNFYLTSVVDRDGEVAWEYDWSRFGDDTDPHEPVLLAGGNLLVCLQNDSPYQAVELNPQTDEIVWTYTHPTGMRTARDCDRLPNGNTLIVAVRHDGPSSLSYDDDDESTIIEVTPEGEVVWQLTLKGYPADRQPGYFYKAERIGAESTRD